MVLERVVVRGHRRNPNKLPEPSPDEPGRKCVRTRAESHLLQEAIQLPLASEFSELAVTFM